MIHGEKPSGYTVTYDRDGRKMEGETRQCVHCQFIWVYQPGSGTRRGYCTKCQGLICARQECIAEQKRLTGNNFDCFPFEEMVKLQMNDIDKLITRGAAPGKDFTTTPNGIIIGKRYQP